MPIPQLVPGAVAGDRGYTCHLNDGSSHSALGSAAARTRLGASDSAPTTAAREYLIDIVFGSSHHQMVVHGPEVTTGPLDASWVSPNPKRWCAPNPSAPKTEVRVVWCRDRL
ncbi:hypothetical protein SAMD00023353_0101120 [Rosellinia necatrix]|uniref:Uncharacterized protein n=1 Tax=Rosellinia necatrix TaxID=77044 RepID=A0A1S8A563_ROSNE|nr:hypothetical protein SAMD00023353_0101120 [Rosellinia necatrix]